MRKLNRHLACVGLVLLGSVGPQAEAVVTEEQFKIRSTQDIVELCSTAQSDPLYTAAINFCQGYLVGAYQYQESLYSGPDIKPVVCPPDPKPTRNEGIALFIQWAKAHPGYGNDRAVDSLAKFLSETWPCKN